MRILIVEDDTALRSALSEALQAFGFAVTAAGTATAASALLRRHHFDAVITDLMLPGNGETVIDVSLSTQPGAPVVVVTASDDPTARARVLDSGAFECLSKPVSARELRDTLGRALAARRRDGGSSSEPPSISRR